jgi:bla regulator protein blaR1
MILRVFACFGLLVLVCDGAFGQSSPIEFEVATIKPSNPNTLGVTFRNAPGGLNISGATLSLLIQQAYDVREFQITGGPGWIHSERYDVAAKIERGNAPADSGNITDQRKGMEQQRERLRNLLAERCRLKIRRETKELQAYVLMPAKGGPKLKESKLDDPAQDPNGDKGGQSPRGPFLRVGRGQIIGQSVNLDFLAQMLSQQLGRPVLDKTSLKGAYDFTLEWTPDQGQAPGLGSGGPGGSLTGKEPPRPDNPAPAESSGPSVFAAIQEQLGLKLESQKAPVEIIVIESIEKPSEN